MSSRRAPTRSKPLDKASTAERIAALEAGIERLHEELDVHAEALAELERELDLELVEPSPDKARLHVLTNSCGSLPVDIRRYRRGLAWMRIYLRRWAARSRTSDKCALNALRPLASAAGARLSGLCETYLELERRLEARFDVDALEAAYDAAFDQFLVAKGVPDVRDLRSMSDEEFEEMRHSFIRASRRPPGEAVIH